MLKTFFFEFWDSINILLDVCGESLHDWLSNFSIWLIKKKERKLFLKENFFPNISIGFQTFYLVNWEKWKEKLFNKGHIFWEGHKLFAKSSPYFWLAFVAFSEYMNLKKNFFPMYDFF